jgi:hypothetical protein
MEMSDSGLIRLLKKFEGCRLKAYRCPADVLTIGYGHTSAAGSPEVTEGMVITQEDADQILKHDLGQYERAVQNLVKTEINQNQFDVLVDFTYNAGVRNLQTSTMLKKINAGDFTAVPTELMKWTKGGGKELPGLVRRRQAECEWWNANQNHPSFHEDHRVEPDPPAPTPPPKSIVESKQANGAIAVGALGSVGAAKEVMAQAQDASDTFEQLLGLLKNTNFLFMVAIVIIGGAIWYWRKKHLEEHGV